MKIMVARNNKTRKKKSPPLPIEITSHASKFESSAITTIADTIELPAELIRGYKELNEKLEETILRIERKRRTKKRRGS